MNASRHRLLLASGIGGVAIVAGLIWLGVAMLWPPNVLDGELARIGPPVSGAHVWGSPWTSSGSVVCLDACLTQTQGYRAAGPLMPLLRDARAHLAIRGYRDLSPLAALRCAEDAWPVLTPHHVQLDCSVSGQTAHFGATIDIRLAGTTPFVPVPPYSGGEATVTAPPGLWLTRHNGSVMVDVDVR
ncbi:MAG TPA: hypothetical protein VMW47_02015 [Verrucomicrobiae bacterium]|nr:hypothetical protein [Verrucomicrobiae bacterium]